MTKPNSLVEQWAIAHGLNTPFETAVFVEHQGIPLSVGYIYNYGITLSVYLNERLDSSSLKAMNQEMKSIGSLYYIKSQNTLHLRYRYNKKNFSEKTDEGIVAFAALLQEHRVPVQTTCSYCGMDQTDSGLEKLPGVIAPVHVACKQQHAGEQLSKIAENKANGNYGLGIIGAVIGAIVGALPAFLGLVVFKVYSAWLFALIPMGLVTGYKKAHGIANNFMKLLAVVIPPFITILTYIATLYVFVLQELHTSIPISDFLSAFSRELPEFLPDLVPMILFTFLGIGFAWSSINKTNRQEEKLLQQMMAVDQVVIPEISHENNELD